MLPPLLVFALLACASDVAPPAAPPAGPAEVPAPTQAKELPQAAVPPADDPPIGPLTELAGTWEQLTERDEAWVIMDWCHAGTPTVRIDADPVAPRIVADFGQEAELYTPSRFAPLADGEGLMVYASPSSAPESPTGFELRWLDREAGLAVFPDLIPGRFVHDSRAGGFERVKEMEDCGTP